MEQIWDKVTALKAQLEKENSVGGELAAHPCPFCRRPRAQRSTYIRCNPCGINWFNGEDYYKDPKIDRFSKVLADAKKVVKGE